MKQLQLLSICIPTFNRLNYLKESLETLIPQALLHDVEICISSNNSTDGTNQFLKELMSQYNFIKCNFHPHGVSIDENMLSVFSMATGKYIYPLGDDDVIAPGDLEHILKEISSGGDLIVMNGWHTDATLTKLRTHLSPSVAGVCFTRPDLAFLRLWDKLPFGSFIATRDCFLEVNIKRYFGTSHAYGGSVWDRLALKYSDIGNCNIRCIKQPVVMLRGADKTWKKNEAQILFVEIPAWFKLMEQHSIYKKPLDTIRLNYMSTVTSVYLLLYLRANRQINYKNIKKYFRHCSFFQKFKLYSVSVLPHKIPLSIIKTRNATAACFKFTKNYLARLVNL